jgi:branched-chain amino acid aminotransferase
MSEQFVYFNGEIIPQNMAVVSVLDRGMLYADGLFETMRVYDGRIFAFDRHMRRMRDSLKRLRFSAPESADDFKNAAAALLKANRLKDTVIRLTITRGVVDGPLGLSGASLPTRIMHCRPLTLAPEDAYENGVAAAISPRPFCVPASIAGIKSLNYLDNLFARQECRDRNCFEVLMRNKDGLIVEGSISNIFAVIDDVVLTAPLGLGALPGITREICLEILKNRNVTVSENAFDFGNLACATEVFLTSSVIEIVPVTKLNDLTIGNGRPGPVFKLLAKEYSRRVMGSIA